MGTRDGVVVIALASHLGGPGSGHEWVKLVVGSLVFSEMFFSGFSGFPLSSKVMQHFQIPESEFLIGSRSFFTLMQTFQLRF